MLILSGKIIESTQSPSAKRQLLSLSTNSALPDALRQTKAYLVKNDTPVPLGFQHYLAIGRRLEMLPEDAQCTVLGSEFAYLDDQDVVALSPGNIRTLFRAESNHNSLLLTEQCNNYCLMCSQPPKRVDDRWLLDEAMETVRMIPRDTKTLGITGGEPTLFGDGFIALLRHIKHWLPHTALHVLSNGRSFANAAFAENYAKVGHADIMLGIPVYSDDSARHDYVVQGLCLTKTLKR
jgi:hypothetical protein